MIYKYTSEENFTIILGYLTIAAKYNITPSRCEYENAVFVINYVFIPCNLTTGTPRPLCSDSCYNFRKHCRHRYNSALLFADLLNIPFVDDCENTLHVINTAFNFPNSSKDFQDDCFNLHDYSGIDSVNLSM